MASTNPARGTRDFLPADVRKREYVIGIIKEVYESYGFEPLETPAFENLETLTGKYGEEGGQLMFKILKRGEKLAEVTKLRSYEVNEETSKLADLALRYDLTVPLARVVANNKNELPKFFKRYQIQPVWRADRPAKGRYREFYQCDVDCIGSTSIVVEAELISAVSKILLRLGFDDFVVRVNHRNTLFGLLRKYGIPDEKVLDTIVILDKIDKIHRTGVEKELSGQGISTDVSRRLLDALEHLVKSDSSSLTGKEKLAATNVLKLLEKFESGFERTWGNKSMTVIAPPREHDADLEKVAKAAVRNQAFFLNLYKELDGDPAGFEGAKELASIVGTLYADTEASVRVLVDPTLARGLSYYTGTIMEINVPDLAGSLGGGGRYDGLIGMFGKEQIPACGISLGLERILVVMDERGMFPPEIADSTPADVMITIWSEETAPESLLLAAELRSQGLRVTVYPEADKLGKQIKYADSIRVPFVCVLGESELADGTVTLKNMRTGEQQTCDRNKVREIISVG
ncbi:MAG: histidine--tRNA ligase [Pyrinomonadaceae bacterium]|nr:histidine--tRNA ligase [Pyrinomonadaceae bacterium]